MKIAFYVSNHGFGHATRVDSLIEYFLSFGIICYVITNRPKFLFEKDSNLIYREKRIDFGIKQDTWIYPNKKKTLISLLDLMKNKDKIIREEVDFFRGENIDFIISDIPFFAFDIAEKLNVPSIGISNFDWHYIYKNMFEKSEEIDRILTSIKQSYKKADFAFRLPFSDLESMNVFNRVYEAKLICRKPKKSQKDILQDFDIPKNKKIVVVTFGGNKENPLKMEELSLSENIIILSKETYFNFSNYRIIPDSYDFTSLLFYADYVITKTGYSSLAETIQGGGFIIATDRSGFPEDKILIDEMKKYPNFLLLKPTEISKFDWKKFFEENKFLRHPIPNKIDETAKKITEKLYSKEKNKYVVMDLGTNNLLILWAIKNGEKIKTIYRMSEVPSLGKEMKNGLLNLQSIKRTKLLLEKYINFSLSFSKNIIILGTSCSREAKNIYLIKDWLEEKFNIKYNIISERTEAELNGLSVLNQYPKLKNIITFDIGGGSTEFTLIKNREIIDYQSIKLGLRRLENTFSQSLSNKKNHTIKLLKNLRFSKKDDFTVIGIGGTAASVAAILQKMKKYDENKINGFLITKKNLEEIYWELKSYDKNKLKDVLSFEPERIEIIQSGIMVLIEILTALKTDNFYVSDLGIQYGLLNYPSKKIKKYM